jgi:hypothetical protein
MELIIKFFELACSGFWTFIGVSLLSSMFLYFGVNGILRVWSKLLRMLVVSFRGWPPSHLDADGDFQDKKETIDKTPKIASQYDEDMSQLGMGVFIIDNDKIRFQKTRYIESGWYVNLIGDEISLWEVIPGGDRPNKIGNYGKLINAIKAGMALD